MSSSEIVNSNITGNGKARHGRPKKIIEVICSWCEESKPPLLKYVWENDKKEFCSKSCIAQFREAHSKGACLQCDNVVIANSPNKEFCSTPCMNKYQRANNTLSTNNTSPAQRQPVAGQNNNNNNNVNNNNSHRDSTATSGSTAPLRTFQYESFHVFNWDDYLKVSKIQIILFCVIIRY